MAIKEFLNINIDLDLTLYAKLADGKKKKIDVKDLTLSSGLRPRPILFRLNWTRRRKMTQKG